MGFTKSPASSSGTATAITETDGPTDLTIAGIADGEFLTRSGSTVAGAAGGSAAHAVDHATTHTAATDITTHNASTSAHGFLKKLSNVATEFMDGQGNWSAIPSDQAAGTASMRTLSTTATTACAGNDARLSDARTPTSHAASHNSGGGDALAADAAAGTASLRSLSTTATTACAGNDSRLSDSRTPTSHAASHNAGGGDALTTVASSNALESATTTVNVSSATAPTNGQILTATGSTTATWQTSAAGVHDLAGAQHNTATLSAFNAKLSDANFGWPVVNRTANDALVGTETGNFFTNAGATGPITFTLPAASAGQEFMFYVAAAYNLIVDSNGGSDNIRIGDAATAAAGQIESANVGDFISLKCINADDWVAISRVGTWNLPTTSQGANTSLYIAKTADYTVLAGDTGTTFANTGAGGAVIFTLPGAAAGLEYTFFCHAAQTVTLTCTTGDTLRVLGSLTSADGTAYTSTGGTVIHIKGQNANGWFTISQMGTWTLT